MCTKGINFNRCMRSLYLRPAHTLQHFLFKMSSVFDQIYTDPSGVQDAWPGGCPLT